MDRQNSPVVTRSQMRRRFHRQRFGRAATGGSPGRTSDLHRLKAGNRNGKIPLPPSQLQTFNSNGSWTAEGFQEAVIPWLVGAEGVTRLGPGMEITPYRSAFQTSHRSTSPGTDGISALGCRTGAESRSVGRVLELAGVR